MVLLISGMIWTEFGSKVVQRGFLSIAVDNSDGQYTTDSAGLKYQVH